MKNTTAYLDQYTLAKHPRTGAWHVIASLGRAKDGKRYAMPVSDGYKTRAEAASRASVLVQANKAMREELSAI